MYKYDLSIIIVSWNTSELLRNCINSILEHTNNLTYEIIVVDNNSEDDSVQAAKEALKEIPNHRVIENDYNAGFAKANNQAYLNAEGTYIALVNSDIRLLDNALYDLLELLKNDSKAGAISCLLHGDDLKPQSIHRRLPNLRIIFFVFSRLGSWIDHRFLRARYHRYYKLQDESKEGLLVVEQAAAAFLIIPAKVVKAIGGLFDEEFPIYGNDVDLGKRISDYGLHTLVDYSTRVWHKGSASLSKSISWRKRAKKTEWLVKYFIKHGTWWERVLIRFFIYV